MSQTPPGTLLQSCESASGAPLIGDSHRILAVLLSSTQGKLRTFNLFEIPAQQKQDHGKRKLNMFKKLFDSAASMGHSKY
jgi:hypothetical protein